MCAKRFIVSVAVMLGVMPVGAHHSISEYDQNKPITLRGTIAKIDWINPHAKIWVEVKEPDGTVTRWSVETGTPNALFRQGITRDSLPAGTPIVVNGWPAKDGSLYAAGRQITFPDGRSLLLLGTVSGQSAR